MGALSGVISGLIGSGQSLPTVDISGLLNTINNAGTYQKSIINALPQEVQQQLAAYAASLNGAGSAYQGNITSQGNNFLQQIQQLYGPNSPAAEAQKVANTQSIYSTVPGTQNAIRNALAATGGLSRGNAATALAQPYVNAAAQNSQINAGVDARQAELGQQATQQALQTINSMDANMFQQLFGMSREQASTILSTGNNTLRQQLADLINQSNTQTGQTLGAQGVAANNAYQNAVTRNAQQNEIWSGVADLGLQGIQAGMGAAGGMPGVMSYLSGGSGLPAGADVGSADYMRNAATMAAAMGQ